jgi:OPA family glycerol-3-phosphate transporter-like MFS transporter
MNFFKSLKRDKTSRLILLCWTVYVCSYLAKLSYSANISRIGDAFGVSYADTGLVTTCFFFAYGLGQIFNGLFCKWYNIKLVVFSVLIISASMNIAVALIPEFTFIKYAWLINGATMSFLWPLLIRLLSETIAEEDIPTATIAMGTTVATGTLIIYCISSLFSVFTDYRATFITAACILGIVSVVWISRFDGLVKPLAAIRTEAQGTTAKKNSGAKSATHGEIWGILIPLAIFAVADNLIKDGLTSWTPDILDSLYSTPPWLSILLTLLLPMMAIFGVSVATKVYKKVKSFVGTCTLLFGMASVLICTVILLLKTSFIPITIGCFAVVACLMAGVNNIITSIMPLYMRERINTGKIAGIMNGFCYLGSTISTYGLGLIAEKTSWIAVFITLIGVSIFVVTIGVVYLFASKLKKR